MLRVYFASKLENADFIRKQLEISPQVHAHARWLRHQDIGTVDNAMNATSFWVEDEDDVKSADLVVVWAGHGQRLRGALVEAGMAIAYGIPVVVVGNHPDYGTWQFHPMVHNVVDFDELRELISRIVATRKEQYHAARRNFFPAT